MQNNNRSFIIRSGDGYAKAELSLRNRKEPRLNYSFLSP